MLAEVVEGDAGVQLGDDELARGAGDEHLAAVRGRADARGAMDVDADVVVGADLGLPGVHAHAHAQIHALGPGVDRQRTLSGHRRGDGVGRAREGDEEGVALGVDLDAAMLLERPAQRAMVLFEDVAVPLAQACQ